MTKNKRITVVVDDETYKLIKAYKNKYYMTESKICSTIIKLYLKKHFDLLEMILEKNIQY